MLVTSLGVAAMTAEVVIHAVVQLVVSALIIAAWLVSSLTVAVMSATGQVQDGGEVNLFDSVLGGLLVAGASAGLVYLLVRLVWAW